MHRATIAGRTSVMIAVGLLWLANAASATARTWTDVSGKFSVEGELTSLVGDKVSLKTADGRSILVPIESLSVSDRKYIEQWKAEKLKRPGTPTTSTSPGTQVEPSNAPATPVKPTPVVGAKKRTDPEAALEKKIKFDFAATPIDDALGILSTETGTPFFLAPEAFGPDKRKAVRTLAGKSEGRSLAEELAGLFQPVQLHFSVLDEAIVIIAEDKASDLLVRRSYRVIDPKLIALTPGVSPVDGTTPLNDALDSLLEELMNIDPNTWGNKGGHGWARSYVPTRPGNAQLSSWGYPMISVLHTFDVHLKISRSFEGRLASVGRDAAASNRGPKPRVDLVQAALDRPVVFEPADISLFEALTKLAESNQITLQFDEQSLTDAGIDLRLTPTPKIDLNGLKLSSVLSHLLRSKQCGFYADSKGIHVTTKVKVDDFRAVVSYDVSDLAQYDAIAFKDMIMATINPQCWEDVGGTCKIDVQSQPATLQAVAQVSADYPTHMALSELLADLRDAFNQPKLNKR